MDDTLPSLGRWWGGLLFVTLVGPQGLGCATSSSEVTSSSSSDMTREDSTRDASGTSGASRSLEDISETLRDMLGRRLEDGPPEGCRGEWVSIQARNFRGRHRACSAYRPVGTTSDRTVLIGIHEERIRRVALQLVFEGTEQAETLHRQWRNRLLNQCQRTGRARRRRMSFQCEGHYASLRMRTYRKGGEVRVVYGLESTDLPR